MAEFDLEEVGYSLKIDGKYHNTLDIEGFSHMMKDPSYCYGNPFACRERYRFILNSEKRSNWVVFLF